MDSFGKMRTPSLSLDHTVCVCVRLNTVCSSPGFRSTDHDDEAIVARCVVYRTGTGIIRPAFISSNAEHSK